jgi:NAD(P)-dependent dehydrogenase (short-subunit alcohol dehydrogenase family)
LRFDGRVAVVTGAGRGLGRAHARLLAERGAAVVVNDVGGGVDGSAGNSGPAEDCATTVVNEIRAAGGAAVIDHHSVASPDGAAAIIATAIDAFGRVDVLVNNAGILRDRTFQHVEPDDLDAVLDVHLRGTFFLSQQAWPIMRAQQYGRIVNTTSSAGLLGNFGQSNYAAAKMAVVGLTRVLAKEGQRYGIAVNAIAPAARTRMTEDLLGRLADHLDPSTVAPVAAWLAHERCTMSGAVLTAFGGRVARYFVGMSHGYFQPGLTMEDVDDHVDEIEDLDGFSIPEAPADEFRLLRHLLSGAEGGTDA